MGLAINWERYNRRQSMDVDEHRYLFASIKLPLRNYLSQSESVREARP